MKETAGQITSKLTTKVRRLQRQLRDAKYEAKGLKDTVDDLHQMISEYTIIRAPTK